MFTFSLTVLRTSGRIGIPSILSIALRYLLGLYQQASQHLKPGGDIEIAGADLAADAIYVPNAPKDSYGSIFVAMQSADDDAEYPRQSKTSCQIVQ
jgi:hypothetical protein